MFSINLYISYYIRVNSSDLNNRLGYNQDKDFIY